MSKIITPKFFPWETVKTILSSKEVLITKVWVDAWWVVTYLWWDWVEYNWYNDFQLEWMKKVKSIWFKI